MSETKDMKNTEELMSLNNLKYELPANLALTEQGSIFKKNFSDQQTYASSSGTEMIFTLQASTDFVYGKNCYLSFDIKADGADTKAHNNCAIGFQNTPATAIFERFLLESKDGSELERIEDLNKMVRNILPWHYPFDYRRQAQMAGQRENVEINQTGDIASASVTDFALNTITACATGQFLRVCIPLHYFSGVFNEETLIPPSLISGMRLRLTFAPPQEALTIIGSSNGQVPEDFTAAALTFTVSNPVVMLETFSLAPAVQRNILEQMGSKEGLPYTYETYYNQKANPGTTAEFNLQVNKAVARAQCLYVVTQNVLPDSAEIDNLGTTQMPYRQYQCRIGDWYAPQQKMDIGGSTDDLASVQRGCAELYINNLQATMGIRDAYMSSSVSLENFRKWYSLSGKTGLTSNSGFATIIQTLNQSPHIGASGLAVNNSRTAEVTLRYADNYKTVNKAITAWLKYVKVASIYPSRCVVKQ